MWISTNSFCVELYHYPTVLLYISTCFYTYVFIFKVLGKRTCLQCRTACLSLISLYTILTPGMMRGSRRNSGQILFRKVFDRCCGSLLMSDRSQTKGDKNFTIIQHLSSSYTTLPALYFTDCCIYMCLSKTFPLFTKTC